MAQSSIDEGWLNQSHDFWAFFIAQWLINQSHLAGLTDSHFLSLGLHQSVHLIWLA